MGVNEPETREIPSRNIQSTTTNNPNQLTYRNQIFLAGKTKHSIKQSDSDIPIDLTFLLLCSSHTAIVTILNLPLRSRPSLLLVRRPSLLCDWKLLSTRTEMIEWRDSSSAAEVVATDGGERAERWLGLMGGGETE
ncbi:hypothetical protein Droror1_Dr00019663 [Drosera rotundifolia]